MTRSALAKPKTRSEKAKKPTAGALRPIRTYKSALNWLDSLTNFERGGLVEYGSNKFKLTRMNRLLAAMDNPHKQLRTVHIAGTKGKGSTATMLAHMLQHGGYKVGLYTSPHLITVRERVAVNGRIIGELAFTRLVRKVAQSASPSDPPTFFEVLTAVAFLHFVNEKVQLAVIETGLGGRLDSTNVIQPEVCGFTSISYDHMGQLGSTLADIAEEKAGILKRKIPAVSVRQSPEVSRVLRDAAERVSAPLRMTGEEIHMSLRFESSRAFGPHTRLSLTTENSRFEHLHVPLLGEHQAHNCALALGMLDALKGRGFEIDDQKAMASLGTVFLAGRMEIIREDPKVLVDGAHNAASIEALMRAIGQNIPYDSMVVIFGCHKDKDIDGMLKRVRLGADKVIFTSTGSSRSVDPSELASRYIELTGKMAQTAFTLGGAMDIAGIVVTKEDLICITGSFYLVGQAKKKYQTN